MKRNKLVIILALAILITVSTFGPAGASSETPLCGNKIIKTSGPISNDFVKVSYGDGVVNFESYNGWDLSYVIVYGFEEHTHAADAEYPNGTTKASLELVDAGGAGSFETSDIDEIMVGLEKRCSVCKPTDLFVYTLLGNYPCNLVSREKSIPDRFRNTNYTGLLCSLPNIQHKWSGEWLKNRVEDCGTYQMGGNHYNSDMPSFP
jgi:hypothetical protein